MIFIWSSEGGPLQYVGLALIAVQLLPHVLQSISMAGLPLAVVLPCFLAGVSLAVLVSLAWGQRRGEAAAAAGEENPTNNNDNNNNNNNTVTSTLLEGLDYVRNGLGQFLAVNRTTTILFYGLAFLMVAGVYTMLLVTGYNPYLAMFIHALIPITLTMFFLHILGGGFGGGQNNNHNEFGYAASNESRQAKLSKIVETIQTMPLEEFVAPEDYAKTCSISQLKRMIQIRQTTTTKTTSPNNNNNATSTTTTENNNNFLERGDLIQALEKCRQFSSSCCICCEDYQPGDPLRVLPKCHHEFHLECLDQWAYTFANHSQKRTKQPTCPLCNTTL